MTPPIVTEGALVQPAPAFVIVIDNAPLDTLAVAVGDVVHPAGPKVTVGDAPTQPLLALVKTTDTIPP